ncbi:hypothetical protein SNE40_004432 [Patella caerulea]|uniref:Uncharacterized protein n=1 Tax=Patella caerulea TaxID=87958 RepID=A0AAN8Q0X5_PATCE
MANVDKLCEQDLKNIAYSQKTQACSLMANCIGIKPYDKEKNLNTDIYVNYLYDHIMFAVERGFPWKSVGIVVNFANRLLKFSKGKSLAETVTWYSKEAENMFPLLGERFFKMYTDFVFSTFLSHYQLYQYVLIKKRDEEIPKVKLQITPPESPEPFKLGKESRIFEYEQTICDIERRESEKVNSLLSDKEKLNDENEIKKEEMFKKYEDREDPLTKESLSDMIKDIITCYTSSLTDDLKTTITQTQDTLQFKLEKTSLPRPQVLGPPPRYKLKTPVSSKDKQTGRKTPEAKPKSGRATASGKSK